MSGHTPTPYSILEFQSGMEVGNYEGENCREVCFVPYQGGSDKEDRCNAEFIVQACNNYQSLVEALEACADELHRLRQVLVPYYASKIEEPDEGVVTKAYEALARARGET